ncbi:hypothetical protein MANES_02G006400v8 [Manihot esculenta]|uniref:Uncharacterized protein n=1 Tax=Manihot esculenta TaxID=3983 RepID=A0A2C9WC03_MANES|nr:hypothetical protein MANES_02G006400v8 [Manihot esculenta]
MAGSQTKALSLILLLLFIHLSIGQVLGVAQGMKYANPQSEPIIAEMKKMRKLIEIDAMLDYEGAGANCKHDPSKKPIGCKP